jgi:hypothetical protein
MGEMTVHMHVSALFRAFLSKVRIIVVRNSQSDGMRTGSFTPCCRC